MEILVVDNLTKQYEGFFAVKGISFALKEGEILGLLGSNGAGKTTTIQMLLSTMIPTNGQITYFGKNFFSHRSEILEKVSFASTYIRLPGRLTIEENLDIYAQIYGVSKNERKKRIEQYLKFFDLWAIRNRESGLLSAGQITRVMLAKAFISNPKIVLLDEPTASLDPDIAQEVREFIKEQQKEQGLSVLLTSHNMNEVTQICNRVLVLQHGSIIANNTPKELAASVKKVHLHLFISRNSEKAAHYFNASNLVYKQESLFFNIEVDEANIAQHLVELAKLDISYDQIFIDKPTLEDYFLNLSRKSKKS